MKKELIKLGSMNPALRPHISVILKSAAPFSSRVDSQIEKDLMEVAKELAFTYDRVAEKAFESLMSDLKKKGLHSHVETLKLQGTNVKISFHVWSKGGGDRGTNPNASDVRVALQRSLGNDWDGKELYDGRLEFTKIFEY